MGPSKPKNKGVSFADVQKMALDTKKYKEKSGAIVPFTQSSRYKASLGNPDISQKLGGGY